MNAVTLAAATRSAEGDQRGLSLTRSSFSGRGDPWREAEVAPDALSRLAQLAHHALRNRNAHRAAFLLHSRLARPRKARSAAGCVEELAQPAVGAILEFGLSADECRIHHQDERADARARSAGALSRRRP